MFWQEDKKDEISIPDDIVDIAFRIECRSLPLDHAHALSQQILSRLPWMEDESQAGIHTIHVAASGNGWLRPENNETELLQVSKRTRMHIRVPKHRIEDCRELSGAKLDIGGFSLVVGEGQTRLLSDASTVFARQVISSDDESEQVFLERQAKELAKMQISVKKMLCGRTNYFKIPDQKITTRTLMLAELSKEESIRLQQHGIGQGRLLGCGLVLPHKGIAPVVLED